MQFKKNILLFVLIPMIIISGAASYYKHVVITDYLVSYEGKCDPETENCFVDCEDEECTAEYYYTAIERHATDIFALCGEDITDCEAANFCPEDEDSCVLTYCDPVEDGEACEDINVF